MKNLTLIVHADIEQALADLLRSLPQVSEFTFTHIEGHGAQDERDPTLSARDRVVGYTPQIRVDVVIGDQDAPAVLDVMRRNGGVAGRGMYWVTPVEEHGRL
jgi:nitrogen regulatory protein P-II 1